MNQEAKKKIHVLTKAIEPDCQEKLLHLDPWFSAFLMHLSFKTVPHMVTPTIKLTCCYFITVML